MPYSKNPQRLHTIAGFFFWWRCLADSNRRAWFCRPLTKPLIQGTTIIYNLTNCNLRLLPFAQIAVQRYNDYFILPNNPTIFFEELELFRYLATVYDVYAVR